MERNRVLWVIFSISLFLVVVLAAGLYFLRPKTTVGPAVADRKPPAVESFDAFEYVRGRTGLPGLQEEADRAEEMVIVVGEPDQKLAEGAPGWEETAGIPVPRELPAPSPAPAPSERVAGTAAPVERPRPQPVPERAPKPVPKPAPQPIRITEYWIQVGSFESRKLADELGRSLTERGLSPKVTTRVVGGSTHYRVRLGPYPNKAEAGKFLEWIRALEGLEGSYISMVTVRRQQP